MAENALPDHHWCCTSCGYNAVIQIHQNKIDKRWTCSCGLSGSFGVDDEPKMTLNVINNIHFTQFVCSKSDGSVSIFGAWFLWDAYIYQ